MNVYPTLAGLAWPVQRTPLFNTIFQESLVGRVTTATYQSYPLYEFTLSYNYLSASDLDQLKGFFLQQQGRLQPFWFDAGTGDNAVVDQAIGVGNGTTTSFSLIHSVGSFTEPVVETFGAPVALNAGVSVAATFSAGSVIYATAPASGAALAWTGNYYYQCRFKKDAAQFDEFMSQLHELGSITLRTYR